MFNMLAAWRFFVGIGIGGEYPAGSVGAAESTGELKNGTRNRWFILFTNSMIDFGFVIGAFVPFVVAVAADSKYYGTIWRTSLGIGVVFPLVLFGLRLKLKEPENFSKNSMKHVRTPYWLVIKFYGLRLATVSLIWFIYNFSSYAFGLYSAPILANIYDSTNAPLSTVFGWNTVLNLFYIPGTLIGAPISDRLGPRYTLILGFLTQSVVGYIMAGNYAKLSQPHLVGAFVVVYGVFLALGELGPGNNIGLLAAKTCATGVRGQYYGIAAAVGKIGAFIGVYVFPFIQKAGGTSADVAFFQFPFWVSSSLCILGAGLAFFMLPNVGQDTIATEDERFREYLTANGFDVSQLGVHPQNTAESTSSMNDEK
ncbi:major facilitator superfamily domain-containing protein [Xylaria sp. CBS 124048]|nr:major facilitator superfamily domain-containing protein [Xylaria sp. CBS 124048]